MNQTLVIGSGVVDVILEIPHLPVKQEDIHIRVQGQQVQDILLPRNTGIMLLNAHRR